MYRCKDRFTASKAGIAILLVITAWMQSSCTMHHGSGLSNHAGPADFHAADSDNDGFLSWPEIEEAYLQALDKAGWSATHLLARFDRDGDDHLAPREHRRFRQQLEEQLRRLEEQTTAETPESYPPFDALDVNDDQLLNNAELEQTPLANAGQYRLFDDNKDGLLDREEYQEYVDSRLVAEQY